MMLDNLIGGVLRRGVTRELRGRRRPRPPVIQPRLDALEGRRLLDGAIALVAGTVNIAPTLIVNSVQVSYTDSSQTMIAVNCNGEVDDFSSADVTSIHFASQGILNFFENFTSVASTAVGGNGVNVFASASGHDSFTGGDGFNLFWVVGGENTLVGGNGNNLFLGVGANDSVTVGTGYNTII